MEIFTCCVCGMIGEEQDMLFNEAGVCYCPKCFDNEYELCTRCNETSKRDGFENGVCNSCFSESLCGRCMYHGCVEICNKCSIKPPVGAKK